MILVIDNYDSFTWNLVHYLQELGAEVEVVRNDALSAAAALALAPEAILLSPGPGTPADAGICLDVIAGAADAGVPLLGVCLGHQAIGEVFGGRVVRGALMHGKTSPVAHDGTGVFAGLPSPFTATRYHCLIVAADTVPEALVANAHDRRRRHGPAPRDAAAPRRPVPPRKHRQRPRPCAARQFPRARRGGAHRRSPPAPRDACPTAGGRSTRTRRRVPSPTCSTEPRATATPPAS